MKKIFLITILYILFIPKVNAYSNKVTFGAIESVFTDFRNRLIESSEYLIYENNGVICTEDKTACKAKMALLSASEYSKDSYLNNGKETWLELGTNYINTKGNIEEPEDGSSHYLKGIVYVGKDISVIGTGSKSRPYKFMNSTDIYISKIYLKNENGKNEEISLIPNDTKLYHYDCNNRAVVTWENNELLFSDIMVPVACRLWFEENE